MSFRSTIVSGGLKTLKAAGVFNAVANSRRRRNRLLILCYHGLSLYDEHHWLPNLYITSQQFRARLQCLKDLGASVLPLGEALARLHARSLPEKSVVITFDDGFYDFYVHALPALADFSYPCTLYLTTHYCAHRVPVITLILDYLLWKSELSTVDLAVWGVAGVRPIGNYPQRQEVVRAVLAWMDSQRLSTFQKNDVACEIATHLGVEYQPILERRMLQIVSHDEASQLSRGGVDLQLHTHRHRTPNDRELFSREIRDNSAVIAELSGKRPSHFCYPSGHHLPEFLPWLQELGIESATTCEKGLARPESHNLILPRVLDDATVDPVRFESLVAGLFA